MYQERISRVLAAMERMGLEQMLVVPLVFCSLVCGSMAIGDTASGI